MCLLLAMSSESLDFKPYDVLLILNPRQQYHRLDMIGLTE